MPIRSDLLTRIETLLGTYHAARGKTARLLIHDERHGADMISIMARLGRGLPANVIPFAVNEVTQIGHEALLFALSLGASGIDLMIDPKRRGETAGLENQIALAAQLITAMGYDGAAQRLSIIDEIDPDAAGDAIWRSFDPKALKATAITPLAGKREAARAAILALNDNAPAPQDAIALDGDAPYGRINIDSSGCTLCLACVSACPMGAIRDNPDRPEVRFVENDCVQCGLCATTCPESVITLEPRFNLTSDVLSPVIMNAEEPATCTRCGKAFGTRSSIERIVETLAGKHSMFQDKDAQALIRMCDNCRIEHQAEKMNDPFAMGKRPPVRRTEDYLIDDDD